MKFTNVILKEGTDMEITVKLSKWWKAGRAYPTTVPGPFRVMVSKEIADQVRSWRFLILVLLIALTAGGSVYTAFHDLSVPAKANDPQAGLLFLKLFTLSDGSLPPFHIFIGFLGPLLGIAMGFDAVNAEQNRGTLSRLLAQPLHRDQVINAKFLAGLIVISTLFLAMGFLVTGIGIIVTGQQPGIEEFLRLLCFIGLCALYVAFWLNLAILCSVRFRQAATSALACIAIWLFLTIFYQLLISVLAKAMMPGQYADEGTIIHFQQRIMDLMRLAPSQLFSDATTTLLMPSVRSLGPLSMEQMAGAIPGPLSLGQSLLLVWPQLTGLIAASVVCFTVSYYSFMRKEVRAR